jgi:hypothetical protein
MVIIIITNPCKPYLTASAPASPTGEAESRLITFSIFREVQMVEALVPPVLAGLLNETVLECLACTYEASASRLAGMLVAQHDASATVLAPEPEPAEPSCWSSGPAVAPLSACTIVVILMQPRSGLARNVTWASLFLFCARLYLFAVGFAPGVWPWLMAPDQHIAFSSNHSCPKRRSLPGGAQKHHS